MDAAAGAVEEVARLVARIRARWPRTRILLRANSGFAREDLMAWCETNGVDFLFGLAKNERLVAEIKPELDLAAAKSQRSGRPERRFKSFMWTTRRTWSRRRRVVAKAEWTNGEANPRFVVTSLRRDACKAKYLYERVYCARGDMENRIMGWVMLFRKKGEHLCVLEARDEREATAKAAPERHWHIVLSKAWREKKNHYPNEVCTSSRVL